MKLIICLLSVVSMVAANSMKCTKQNCIFSFDKMDDDKFEEIVVEDFPEILAVKFTTTVLTTVPERLFKRFPAMLCLMTTSPGLSSVDEKSFSGASNLQFLYLPGNQIKNLGSRSFASASNLNEINLGNNEIEVVAEDAFDGLEHLESLSLSGNQIAFFGQSTFAEMPDLMNLDISGNIIEFLDARLFVDNPKLNGINIANNQIVSITNQFLLVLPQVKVLNVMNNPCTNNTMLQTIPLIKITDSKDRNSEDESALKKCYQNFMEMADPESTDMNDILSKADIVLEDIEANIISELNEELREKDVVIDDMEKREDIIRKFFLLSCAIIFCFLVLKFVIHIVNSTYNNEVIKKFNEKVEVVKVDPQQVVYTIDF